MPLVDPAPEVGNVYVKVRSPQQSPVGRALDEPEMNLVATQTDWRDAASSIILPVP